MTGPDQLIERLSAPFPPDRVSWRVGTLSRDKAKCMALAYIDARDVIDRLNAVCGAYWQATYQQMPNETLCCSIGITIDGAVHWRQGGTSAVPVIVPKSDSYGDRVKAQDQREMKEKGAYSDALKRAAVMWGIGRYLYDIPSPWVATDRNGDYVNGIAEHEKAGLRALLERHSGGVPASAPPQAAIPPPLPPSAPADKVWDETSRHAAAKLASRLGQCTADASIEVLVKENAELIDAMPLEWRRRWDDAVQKQRKMIETVSYVTA